MNVDDHAFGDGPEQRPTVERADEILRGRFDRYRQDTLRVLRPAGAVSVRRAYRRRRSTRLVAVGAATAAVVLLVVGGGYAAVRHPEPPGPVIAPPSPTVTPAPSATPTPTPSRSTPVPPRPTATRPSGRATAGAPAGSASTPATVPACQTADLALGRVGSEGAAGRGTAWFSLTNRSARRCSLTGWPRVRAVDDGGTAYPVTVPRVGAGPRRVLDPEEAVYTGVTMSSVPAQGYEGAPCDPGAAALWISPPGGAGHLAATGPWRICDTWYLEVTGFGTDRPAVGGP